MQLGGYVPARKVSVEPIAGRILRDPGLSIGYVPQVETVNWYFPVTVREDGERRPRGTLAGASAKALQAPGMGGFPPALWISRSEGPERISGAWWARGGAREYWRVETDVPVGRVAAWILGVEEQGQRGKAS